MNLESLKTYHFLEALKGGGLIYLNKFKVFLDLGGYLANLIFLVFNLVNSRRETPLEMAKKKANARTEVGLGN